MFQHTAARRRLGNNTDNGFFRIFVSTHSRPKAAGRLCIISSVLSAVSTHSRPKAAGSKRAFSFSSSSRVSTHSRPKAAGLDKRRSNSKHDVSTHSRPKAAGLITDGRTAHGIQFQHTAARRRLDDYNIDDLPVLDVSTHSRPKAAGCLYYGTGVVIEVSTHSRPKAAGR